MPDILFEDEWIATDPQVRRCIEIVTGKPFPDPERYYKVTNIVKKCNFCGWRVGHWRPDPLDLSQDSPVYRWICPECYHERRMDS
jgi:hypothetical protein